MWSLARPEDREKALVGYRQGEAGEAGRFVESLVFRTVCRKSGKRSGENDETVGRDTDGGKRIGCVRRSAC